MYQLGVQSSFVAQHFLVGGDFGRENQWHSHHYRADVVLDGNALDRHGFLVDIVELRAALGGVIERYRDHTLNELPEFEGLNPSLEHFARLFGERLAEAIGTQRLDRIRVVLWEDEAAWASWERGPG